MSKRIKLYWYRHLQGHGNFGDALNPYIIEKLTGKDAVFVDIYYFGLGPLLFTKTATYDFLNHKINLASFIRYLFYYFISKPVILVAVGSILQLVKSRNIIVWGAGVIAENVSKFSKADFRAVRGKCTQAVIKKQGYTPPKITGDPAILLPLLFQPECSKKYKIGIIPHFIHYSDLQGLETDDVLIVNLLDPIEKVIADINSCEFTLSSSLHGIIVSHAYSIPSLWVTSDRNKLDGDDIKFADYFSSVNLKIYPPIDMFSIADRITDIEELLKSYIEENKIPSQDIIKEIQIGLLRSFPYKLRYEFTKYLENPEIS